jgi:hypothetical protein
MRTELTNFWLWLYRCYSTAMHFSRREIVSHLSALWSLSALASPQNEWTQQLANLEKSSGGRLGVCILDTAHNKSILRRIDDNFLTAECQNSDSEKDMLSPGLAEVGTLTWRWSTLAKP